MNLFLLYASKSPSYTNKKEEVLNENHKNKNPLALFHFNACFYDAYDHKEIEFKIVFICIM